MTTKTKIAEQVQRLYSRFKGERENTKPIFDKRELYELINQSINRIVSAKSLEGFKEGNVDIPQSSLILYTGQTVVSDSGTSYVDLPVYPIRLPLEIGIYEITPAGDPLNPFIPLPRETAQLMQGSIVSALEQKVGFYLEAGKRVRFTTNIFSTNGTVDIRLLVSDISTLAVDDPLPLNADYEVLVIQDVLQVVGMGQVSLTELQSQLNNKNAD
jgi:hypothetical protein